MLEHQCEIFAGKFFGPIHVRTGKRSVDEIVVEHLWLGADEIRGVVDSLVPFSGRALLFLVG